MASSGRWSRLDVAPEELSLGTTLENGQCFNWRATKANEWRGVLARQVIALRQAKGGVDFRCLNDENGEEAARAQLKSYFHLGTPLAPLYKLWSEGDARMKQVAMHIKGMRVLQQHPTECLFSFICSSNNNIPRIIQMLTKLRSNFGELLLEEDGEAHYSFPTIERLAEVQEEELRTLGFGYRAKYIVQTAKLLQEQGDGDKWLVELRGRPRAEVQEELLKFSGVGPKVADCVALFSLDQHDCIPVDTHVWQIAIRDYDPSLKDAKSVTPTIYERVGDLFRERFGAHAGWAHSLLFAAELPQFTKHLPKKLQDDMEEFRKHEKQAKLALKEAKSPGKSPAKSPKAKSPKAKSPKAKSPKSSAKKEKKEKKEKKDKKEKKEKKDKEERKRKKKEKREEEEPPTPTADDASSSKTGGGREGQDGRVEEEPSEGAGGYRIPKKKRPKRA